MAGGARKSARSKIRSSADADGDEDDGVRQTKPPPRLRKEKRRDGNLIRIFGFDLKTFVGIGIVASVIIVVLVTNVTKPVGNVGRPRVVTPFPAPKLMDLPQFQGEHMESLYWGTYRPQVYLGIRARKFCSLIKKVMYGKTWTEISTTESLLTEWFDSGDYPLAHLTLYGLGIISW